MDSDYRYRRDVRCFWAAMWIFQIWAWMVFVAAPYLKQIDGRLDRLADALERMAPKPPEGAK